MDKIDFNNDKFDGIKVAADWIRDLESSDSRLHKEAVIEKALMAANLGSAGAQCFLFNCYQAYNPYYVFGVRQVPETVGLIDQPNPWPTFWALLEALRTRSITGHRARDRIQEVAEQFDSDEWNGLARRVLIKDLRCGISEKTINKVVGKTQWRIPVFTCQLAQDSAGQPTKLRGIKRLEVKLDGVRILAVVTGDVVNLYSRNGKPMDNFPQVVEAIEANRKLFQYGSNMSGRFVLDGEIVGKSFQELMRQAHRKSDAQTEHMVYHVFDIIPLDDFERGFWNAPQHKRLALLDRARETLTAEDLIQVMPGMDVDLDGAEGHDVMRRFAEASVEQGYEGIMIKSLDAPYQCKRVDAWMKWKPFIEVSLEVTDVEQGTGRNEGRLGALVCSGRDDGKDITVNVGSGFSDDLRDQLWRDHIDGNRVVGQIVEVRADAVTQNQDGTYSLRFPRFKTFRGFEPGEKL
jgi:DNA ligase-1